MATNPRKLAAFRKRLAARQALWGIEMPARRRITLDLTPEQQAILKRSTKHFVPSVTLIFSSNRLEPTGHALACLKLGDFAKRAAASRRRRSRPARS